MTYDPTPRVVKGLADRLCETRDTKIIKKSSAKEMKLVARVLDMMGIQDEKMFLSSFATTIPACRLLGIRKSRIYLPFELGDPESLELRRQIEVLNHEFHHVDQGHASPLRMPLRYLTSKAKRAWYESRAMHAELEMIWFLRGKLPHVAGIANRLRFYGVRESDIRVANKHLQIVSSIVERGLVYHQVSKDAILYLKKHQPRRSR